MSEGLQKIQKAEDTFAAHRDLLQAKAEEIYETLKKEPISLVTRIKGLLTDLRSMDFDIRKKEADFALAMKKKDDELLAWSAKVNELSRRLSPLETTDRDQQKEIFWLKEHYDNLLDRLTRRD